MPTLLLFPTMMPSRARQSFTMKGAMPEIDCDINCAHCQRRCPIYCNACLPDPPLQCPLQACASPFEIRFHVQIHRTAGLIRLISVIRSIKPAVTAQYLLSITLHHHIPLISCLSLCKLCLHETTFSSASSFALFCYTTYASVVPNSSYPQ